MRSKNKNVAMAVAAGAETYRREDHARPRLARRADAAASRLDPLLYELIERDLAVLEREA